MKVLDGAGHILSSNLLTLAYPKLLSAPTYSVTASVVKPTSVNPREYDIEIKASGPALYVVLTSSAHGRFSENCFYISKRPRMVRAHFVHRRGSIQGADNLSCRTPWEMSSISDLHLHIESNNAHLTKRKTGGAQSPKRCYY